MTGFAVKSAYCSPRGASVEYQFILIQSLPEEYVASVCNTLVIIKIGIDEGHYTGKLSVMSVFLQEVTFPLRFLKLSSVSLVLNSLCLTSCYLFFLC